MGRFHPWWLRRFQKGQTRSHLHFFARSQPLCFAVTRIFKAVSRRRGGGSASAEFSITLRLVVLHLCRHWRLWEARLGVPILLSRCDKTIGSGAKCSLKNDGGSWEPP